MSVCRTLGYVVLLGLVSGSAARAAGAPGGDTEEVKKLLTARRDTLRKALESAQTMYRAGRVPLETLQRPAWLLLHAELDVATRPEDRIEAHLSYFKLTVQIEEMALARHEAGLATVLDCHLARAARLHAEADLRKAGGKPPKDVKPSRELSAVPEKD